MLTHDKAGDNARGYSMVQIDELLNHQAFSYHFYRHTGEPFHQMTASNGITQAVKVRELEFRQGRLEEGCMLIVEKTGDDIALKPVPLKNLSLFGQKTWRFINSMPT